MLHVLASRFGSVSGSLVLASAVLVAGASASASGCGGDSESPTTSSGGSGGTMVQPSTGGSGGTGGTAGSASGGGGSASGGGGSGGGCDLIPVDKNHMPAMKLADTGLYDDIAHDKISANVSPYEPAYALWADGAGKGRWAYIPPCAQIDNTDEDHWLFPVGTRFWKEFDVTQDGKTIRIETRMLEHDGPDPADWIYVTYQWNADGTDATLTAPGSGIDNANGTSHDIPGWPSQCATCHGTQQQDHVNGFSAVQLSGPGATGLNLAALAQKKLLKVPPKPGGYPVPGTPTEQAALGYLHANCGHCHNEVGNAGAGFHLRLNVADTAVAMTGTYKTGLNVPTQMFHDDGVQFRIQGGNDLLSCVWDRMNHRGTTAQMPPLATEDVDSAALKTISTWILALPPPN